MVSQGMKCIKYLLFIFNLLFFVVGLGLIIAGALVQTKFHSYFIFFGGQFNGAAILLIAIGVIIFIVAFFGCLGAFKESHCMLMAFTILLVIVFILEVAAAIAAHILNSKLKEMVASRMADSIGQYDNNTDVQKVWNKTQSMLNCCGSTSYTDWGMSENLNKTASVPDSCCVLVSNGCGAEQLIQLNPTNIYEEGCATKMTSWAENNIAIIGGVAIGVAIVEILGIILACCLAYAIRKDYTPL